MVGRLMMVAACVLVSAAWSHRAAAQGSITLRAVAWTDPGAPVTLADVAILDGAEALALAQAVIIAGEERRDSMVVDVPAVREAIGKAQVNWGRVALRGTECRIETRRPAPEPATPAVGVPAPPVDRSDSIRAHVERRLASLLAVDAADLRATFDQRDAALLDRALGGRRLDVRPRGDGDRVLVGVTVYDGERVAEDAVVRVAVLVRREVAVATRALGRGDSIGPGDVTADRRWMGLDERAVDAAQARGSVVRGRVAAGSVVRARDIEPPIVVKRGDRVWVHCVSGTVVLRLEARAREAGREGELVEFEWVSDPDRRFQARMSGPGKAVLAMQDRAGATVVAASARTEEAP